MDLQARLARRRSDRTDRQNPADRRRHLILSVPQARKLVTACASDQECRPLLASITIGLFAGLRTGEVATLDWQNVRLTGKQQFIEVAARNAKTRQRRIASVSDNLSSWLKPLARVAGPVVPDRYRGRHERLQALAKLIPWRRNVLRHSFGSYHLAWRVTRRAHFVSNSRCLPRILLPDPKNCCVERIMELHLA